MKNKIVFRTLALMLLFSILSVNGVFAAGAELPKGHNNNNTELRMTKYDVVRMYDTYQGEEITVEEVRELSSGAKAYYVGVVKCIGRSGWFGEYHYLGNLNDFTLIKVVAPNGTVITPRRYQ